MRDVARLFEAVAAERRAARPVVGIVGELYVMLNRFSNRDLVREVEAAGGEALQSTFVDWLVLTDWSRAFGAWQRGDYREWAKAHLVHAYQVWTEHRLRRPVHHLLHQPPESGIPATMKALAAYYEPRLGTEGVLTMGRAIDYARHGVSGILNVLPFSCMPGIVAAGMAPRLRQDLDAIPWLDLSYDCQQDTNIRTRLEAFMHQVAGFRRRRRRGAAC
jgi:predicted nucleotide-binding protein (sugar kinase/HSP70/actin superfamily)